ncbi:MAG: hypothetical protein DMG60_15340 [Acidobacteria bacterium]|nr:MAG: hypothetical protein DMG60_15340 [Acidobacteriota bacterium]
MDQLHGFGINSAPQNFDPKRDLPPGFLEFFIPLHQRFTPRQRDLIAKRKRVLADAHGGKLPNHLPPSEATTGKWSITLPEWCQDQRNQMTGPADDAELVVKMLNSGAPGVMLDLEDSMANIWDHLELGINNIHAALRGELTYFDKKREALWWTDLFNEMERLRRWQPGYIKCMALVESHPQAFQMEEFLYNLRDHILGLNLGRWDYMASLIHFNLNDPEWVLPDRNTIPHDVAFFQNLRDLLVSICHRRGAFAIGGMTALYPDRANPELNDRALAVLKKDKKNESDRGFDGAWTGHPDQNQIAVDQFPFPNQIKTHKPMGERYPNLRPQPTGVGRRTLSGTRAAVRTVIRYRNGVLNGKGASLLDGYMEDLATDRIYRLMIAQRIQHRDKVELTDDNGKQVKHTPELITRLFDEELEKLVNDLPDGDPQIDTFRQARKIAEAMIVNGEVDPV